MADQSVLEFEPVSLDGNTEVKRPYTMCSEDSEHTGTLTDTSNSDETCIRVSVVEETDMIPINRSTGTDTYLENDDDVVDADNSDDIFVNIDVSDVSSYDMDALEEYRKLRDLYREFPRDMFVRQVLVDYSSSEPDLDRVRTKLFEHIKHVVIDFPFGKDAELKRRVSTRTGGSVAQKLAQDIHSIIEVTEENDCNVLKPLISARKVSTCRRSVMSKRNAKVDHAIATGTANVACSCGNELLVLKDTIATIQADLLLVKQAHHACEKLRCEQINAVKSMIIQIKSDIKACSVDVEACTGNATKSMGNLTTNLMRNVIAFEDRVRLLETFIDTENIVTIAKVSCQQCDGDNNDGSQQTETDQTAMPENHNQGKDNVNDHLTDNCDTVKTTVPGPGQEELIDPNTLNGRVNDKGEIDPPKYDDVVRPDSEMRRFNVNRRKLQPEPVLTSADNDVSGLSIPRVGRRKDRIHKIGQKIPVRITRQQQTTGERDDVDDNGFMVKTSRFTKRYCVLGLSSKVNTAVLTNVINKKGPRVSAIRVFPISRNPSKVLLRINVHANKKADLLLRKDFWPEYVTCKPWNSRRSRPSKDVAPKRARSSTPIRDVPRSRRYNKRVDNDELHEYSGIVRTNFFDENRFHPISEISNVD